MLQILFPIFLTAFTNQDSIDKRFPIEVVCRSSKIDINQQATFIIKIRNDSDDTLWIPEEITMNRYKGPTDIEYEVVDSNFRKYDWGWDIDYILVIEKNIPLFKRKDRLFHIGIPSIYFEKPGTYNIRLHIHLENFNKSAKTVVTEWYQIRVAAGLNK